MFFNYIKSAFIRKNIGLYVFFFALLLGQNNPNYSLSFDGVDDMIQIPDNDLYDFVNEFSVGFKFKPSLEFDGGWLATKGWDGHGQTNRIWSFYAYHDRSDYYVEFVTSEGFHQFDVPASFSINEWNALLVTYDGNFMRFYDDRSFISIVEV